jgi:hypothetical protein
VLQAIAHFSNTAFTATVATDPMHTALCLCTPVTAKVHARCAHSVVAAACASLVPRLYLACTSLVPRLYRNLGVGMGLRPEQLVLYGLPIRPIFSKKLPSKSSLRKRLVSDGRRGGVLCSDNCNIVGDVCTHHG